MKKLPLFPFFLLLCALFTLSASAETVEGIYGENITWEYDTETGHLDILGSGAMDDYGEALWCDYFDTLKSITVADGITRIGAYTFRYLENLTELSLPNSVTAIGELAFTGCSNLRHLTFPSGLTEIEYGAFNDCTLYEIELPGTVTTIGDFAFWYCGGVREVHIPASVTSLSGSAFNKCISLRTLTVDEENPVYRSEGNCIIEKATGLLVCGCRESVIPDDGSITEIGEYAFACCDYLTEIDIPDGVTAIGANAFEDCFRLTSVRIPDSIDFIGGSAFLGCTVLNGVTLPSGLTTLDELAFYDCAALEKLDLPDSLLVIGNQAFYGCSSLTELVFPEDAVLFVGMFAFGNCSGLTELTLPQSVSMIDWCAFSGCTRLKTLTFHNGVEEIASGAFDGCPTLETVNFFGSMADWDAIETDGETGLSDAVTVHWFVPTESGFVCEKCGLRFRTDSDPANRSHAENESLGWAEAYSDDPDELESHVLLCPTGACMGDMFIVVRYRGGRMNEVQTAVYTGAPLEFSFAFSYDEIRIFALADFLPDAEPLTLPSPSG